MLVLDLFNDFLEKAQRLSQEEAIKLLTFMKRKNVFSYCYITGLQTRVVGKHGKILINNDNDPDVQEAKVRSYNVLYNETEMGKQEESFKDYLQSKKEFIHDYIVEDKDELIDLDEVNRKIVKRTEKHLSLIDEDSLDLLDNKTNIN